MKSEKPQLTEKQVEILTYISKGLDQESIAKMLGISYHSARDRIKGLYKKLDVHNAGEAVSEGYQLGYLKVIE